MDRVQRGSRIRRGVGQFALLAAAVCVLACGPGKAAAQDTAGTPSAAEELATVPVGPDTGAQYVGVVADTEIYIAVVDYGNGHVNVYLCDGADVSVWIEGDGNAESGDFTGSGANGVAVSGKIADGDVTGTVTLADGETAAFTAQRAELPAGLYATVLFEDGQPVQARTIVLSNQTARGKKTAFDCTLSQNSYELFMDRYRAADPDSLDSYYWGNASHNEFLRAQKAGCRWAAGPTT